MSSVQKGATVEVWTQYSCGLFQRTSRAVSIWVPLGEEAVRSQSTFGSTHVGSATGAADTRRVLKERMTRLMSFILEGFYRIFDAGNCGLLQVRIGWP